MISTGTRPSRRPQHLPTRPARWPGLPVGDDGMSTAEYAIGTIAAAAFAALLYAVVTGDSVLAGLTALIERALSVSL
jgi:hypothetical protein